MKFYFGFAYDNEELRYTTTSCLTPEQAKEEMFKKAANKYIIEVEVPEPVVPSAKITKVK